MKLKKARIALCLLACAAFVGVASEPVNAYYEEARANSTYIYDEFGWKMKTPDAYEFATQLDLRTVGENEVTSLADMCVTDKKEIFILESGLGMVFRYDENFNLISILSEFKLSDGTTTTLKKPEGVFVSSKGVMYIADTANARVIVCDLEGNVSLIVEKPENILGTNLESFLPVKAVADSAGRISIVARNINSGIMQFSKDGIFTGYTGAPAVQVSALDKFLRKFYTEKQLASMTTYVPTEYNNIKIDANNFIWGTISSLKTDSITAAITNMDLSGTTTPIKKLNMQGSDVLVRKDTFAPLGDLMFSETPSKIVDVGLGPNGIYSMLDSTEGRIFSYNASGIMLYIFGGKGTAKGDVQTPIAVDYIGDKILVLDSGLRSILVYEPTYYGNLLISAEGYYNEGDYTNANEAWKEVTTINANFKYPYIGLGNAEYNAGNYEDAMAYFEYADDKDLYSNAKEKIRKVVVEDAFPIVVSVIIVLIVISIGKGAFKKIRSYIKGELVTYGEGDED
ncbi:MAG: hypothetical protein J6B39_08100 [Lachnospiraceae bacterium]|nr:hypothetical protein [Lachnospiraceae bacterium]